MREKRKSEWKGALKAIFVVAVLCVGIGIAVAAWDDTKSTSDALLATEWNAQVSDQQNRTNSATLVVAASDSRITTTADYVCDGTADQVQINDAITALPSDGGKIVLLEGTYSIAAQIDMQKDNIGLVGMGKNITILELGYTAGHPDTMMIDASGTDGTHRKNIELSDFTIDTNGYGTYYIKMIYVDGLKITNCYFDSSSVSSWTGGWILYSASSDIYINNCEFVHASSNTGYGMFIGGDLPSARIGITDAVITNNYFKNMGYNAISLYGGSKRVHIAGNTIINDLSNSGHGGIGLSAATDCTVIGNYVEGINEAGGEPGGEGGIEIECKTTHGVGWTENNTIIGNVVKDCTMGIYVRDQCTDYSARNNIISSNYIADCHDGIYIHGADTNNNTFVDNTLVGNTNQVTNDGLGSNNILRNNLGYNPVGISSISVGASPFTYTAGASPESVYVSGGTVTSITKSGNNFGLINGTFNLEPYESIIVTYSGTPTMYKDVQ